MGVKDFKLLSLFGYGVFGEVRICKKKTSGQVYAMKKLQISELLLYLSFQDDEFLYLIMKHLPEGDVMTLLMRNDILTDYDARFYVAETDLAFQSIHKHNYIYRDINPDNMLLDRYGQLRLSDFALCKSLDCGILQEHDSSVRGRSNEISESEERSEVSASKHGGNRGSLLALFFFAVITEIWGEFLALGENAFQSFGVEKMTILISTSQIEKIESVIDVKVGEELFRVYISKITCFGEKIKVDPKDVKGKATMETMVSSSDSSSSSSSPKADHGEAADDNNFENRNEFNSDYTGKADFTRGIFENQIAELEKKGLRPLMKGEMTVGWTKRQKWNSRSVNGTYGK
ncbi:hypothetical protein GQ457_13G024350 [Hibiscus cannabinus]